MTNLGETYDFLKTGPLIKTLTPSFALMIPISCNRGTACVSEKIWRFL